ncbi:MAG: hypothetical protein AAF351_06975 [Pseudomonadota bacterium]
MGLRFLPLIAGIVPLLASFGALLIGIYAGSLQVCFPPIDGCMSISATGRTPPGSYWFKALMLPQAVLLFAVFALSATWLRRLSTTVSNARCRTIVVAAAIAAVAVIVYVTFLGTNEPIYKFMRRGGIYFAFVGLFVAEFTLAQGLRRGAIETMRHDLKLLANGMLFLCLTPLALGLLNLGLKATLGREAADAPENAIEWIASVLLQSYYFLLYVAWRKTHVRLSLSTSTP